MDTLETARLWLRRPTADDADFLLELLNDPGFLEHIGDRGVRDLGAARAYVDTAVLASYERHGYGMRVVVIRSTGERAGLCGLVRRDWLSHTDLGYAFLPAYRGHGYAEEAAAAVAADAFGRLSIPRLVAIVSPANGRSMALLAKIGFTPAGEVSAPGESKALRLYARDA
ncbi:MAG: GNAT family N-acetyltransferase [Steroidobacteraceae bacterium]